MVLLQADTTFEYYTLGIALVVIVVEPLIVCWLGQSITEEVNLHLASW